MKFDIGKAVFIVLLIVGWALVARIYGLGAYEIGILDNICYLMFMIVACIVLVVLARYGLIKVLAWIDDSTTDGSKSSIFPILSVVVNLVVILSFMYVVMSHYGIDLMVIVTSLGIMGLAISFGAQSTLQQFFSGIGMMVTRSVRTGDVVRLQGDDTRLIVKSIGVMTTTFTSMENEEIIIMPNNVVSGATVCNMTADAEYYCINLIMMFDIGSRPLKDVYDILIQSAYHVEHIVIDGSLPKPDVQFMNFDGGNVRTKLLAYVDDVHYYDGVVSNLIMTVTDSLRENELLPNGGANLYIREARDETNVKD